MFPTITKSVLCAVCCIAVLVHSTQAAITPVYENDNSELNFDSSIINNDLINAGQATLTSAVSTRIPSFGKAGTTGTPQYNPTGLYDGVNNSPAVNGTSNTFYPAATTPSSVTFRLNTSANTDGYDLNTIRTLAGWAGVNSTQANQKYELLVSQVGSPTFKSLGVYTHTPFTSGTAGSSTRITLTDSLGALAANIDAVRFNLYPHGVNGNNTNPGTVYREFDAVGSAAAAAAPVFTNLVQNGSFEANVLASNSTSQRTSASPLSNWTTSGTITLVNFSFNTTASDGPNWLSLEANGPTAPTNFGSISQTLTTIPGQLYELSFDYNVLSSNSATITNPWKLTYGIDGNNADLTLPNVITNHQGLSAWEHHSSTFVATSTSTTLSFTGFSQIGGFYGAAIDNVAVVTAIPEPSALAWLLGLVPAGAWLLKRR